MLNVSGKISPFELEIYDAIHQSVSKLRIPFLLVGASARDLVLHHAHGAQVIRATGDIDIAVQVRAWEDFTALKSALLEKGFTESDQKQRLISSIGLPVDIVPFGGIEDGKSRIHWMPEGIIRMSVLGLREALEHADLVRIRDEPVLDLPVATLAGLSILKILAWTERSADLRKKDAIDLLYLLKNCEHTAPIKDQIFETGEVLENYGWDTSLTAAHLLGIAAKRIMSLETATFFSEFQAGEMTPLVIERLVEDMSSFDDQYDRNKALTNAYFSGMPSL